MEKTTAHMTKLERKMAEKPVVEQELKLSKTDLIDMAFHVQERDFSAAAKTESAAIDKLRKEIEVDARKAFEKASKLKCSKVELQRWDKGRWSVTATVLGHEFHGNLKIQDLGEDLPRRVTELKRRENALQAATGKLADMRKSRGRFKREYLARLLDSTPEGKAILEQLKSVTFKLGETPSLPVSMR